MRLLQFAAVSIFAVTAANATTLQLISNGDFETGNISGWVSTVLSNLNTSGSCNNPFAAQTTATGCATGVNPASGSFAAYSSTSFPDIENSYGEWDNFFRQAVAVPYGNITNAVLTWDDTATWAGKGAYRGVQLYAAIMQNGLYITSGQFSITNPTASSSSPWTARSLDLTSILQAHRGENLVVEFGSLTFFDTNNAIDTSSTTVIYGVDNAQLNVTGDVSVTPEPETFGLAAVVLAGLYLASKPRR